MSKTVTISECSKAFIHELGQTFDDATIKSWSQNSSDEMERAELVEWLKQEVDIDKEHHFTVESLRASLLEDLADSFLSPEEKVKKNEQNNEKTSWVNRALFIYLGIAGSLLALCEGFDGIASILGTFTAVPTITIFAAGLAFSLVSVFLFYVFDLVDIAKQLEVSFGKSTQLLDVFLREVNQLNRLRLCIEESYLEKSTDAAMRSQYQEMIVMLTLRYQALEEARKAYNKALENPSLFLHIAKITTSTMTAVIFFGGGFFVGQTLALTLAGLFVASVSPIFWPVIVGSAIVGLAALSLYWFIERPGLENLVGYWLGLDKENIEAFAGAEVVAEETRQLEKFKHKIALFDELQEQISQLTDSNDKINTHQKEFFLPEVVIEKKQPLTAPIHGLFKRPRSRSLDDLSTECFTSPKCI